MSTISTKVLSPSAVNQPAVLPLQDGDHLTAAEFERRYDAMPDLKKAELIDGVVHMAPAADSYHGNPQFNFVTFLGTYVWSTPGVRGGDNSSLKLDQKNMPQPDAYLSIEPSHGGRVKIDEKGYITSAPDLIAEISASSASYDLHEKMEMYRRHGVKEYVVWRVKEQAVDWFILRGEQFQPLAPVDGIYRSENFPGLWLAALPLVARDFAQVRQVLQSGLASPEHHAFLEHLQKQSAK